jgi:hypothetical protein
MSLELVHILAIGFFRLSLGQSRSHPFVNVSTANNKHDRNDKTCRYQYWCLLHYSLSHNLSFSRNLVQSSSPRISRLFRIDPARAYNGDRARFIRIPRQDGPCNSMHGTSVPTQDPHRKHETGSVPINPRRIPLASVKGTEKEEPCSGSDRGMYNPASIPTPATRRETGWVKSIRGRSRSSFVYRLAWPFILG